VVKKLFSFWLHILWLYQDCLTGCPYIELKHRSRVAEGSSEDTVMKKMQRFEVLECNLETDHDAWVAEQFAFVPLPEGELLPSLANLAGITHLVG